MRKEEKNTTLCILRNYSDWFDIYSLFVILETPSELRRTEIRTSFKPRHAVVGPSPALSQAVRSRSSEPVHSHSRNSDAVHSRSDAVHSRSTVVDSPAPSTTSTAFSLNPAQIEECAAMVIILIFWWGRHGCFYYP